MEDLKAHLVVIKEMDDSQACGLRSIYDDKIGCFSDHPDVANLLMSNLRTFYA